MSRNAFDFRGFDAVLYKEVKHVLRDRITLFLSLFLPIVQLTLFGYAINMKVEHIRTAFLNEDGGALSVRFLDGLRASNMFDLADVATSRRDLDEFVVSGRSRVAFDIPPNFTADLRSGRRASVQVMIDGSDSVVAQPAFSAATEIGAAVSGAATQRIDVRPRVLFNPSLRSANFLVPGLIGVIMQLITMFLTALSIVGERERGTLDQLLVTPVGVMGLMLGKIAPYAAIGFLDFLLVLGAMRWIFEVPIAGNIFLLLALSAAFLVAALGLGLLVSSFARTQVQAMLGAFGLTLPSILLSGFFFERSLMPPVMQWLGDAIPLTYFLEILRGIILRGAGLAELWPQVVAMLALATVLIVAASIRFARSATS